MKFSEEMRFPHPVLSDFTGDFTNGEFNFSVSVEERPADGQLKIAYKCEITEPSIDALIKGGEARAGFFVTCLETYFNQLEPATLGEGNIVFPGGILNGRVALRPIVWTARQLSAWSSQYMHEEFGDSPLQLDEFEIISIGNEIIINVGWEKLRPLETIFTLAVSSELKDGEINVDLESDRIKILVSTETHDSINRIRGYIGGRAILLNGVYFPVVMEVLRNLSAETQLYEQRRWYRPFIAKCEHLSISLEDPELFEDAQRLLALPYLRMMEHEAKIFS